MITYEWEITGLIVHNAIEGFTKPISVINWCLIGTDSVDGCQGVVHKLTEMDLVDMDPLKFIEFDDLTEAKILEWVHESLRADKEIPDPRNEGETFIEDGDLTHHKRRIGLRIEEARKKIIETEVTVLPWVEENDFEDLP